MEKEMEHGMETGIIGSFIYFHQHPRLLRHPMYTLCGLRRQITRLQTKHVGMLGNLSHPMASGWGFRGLGCKFEGIEFQSTY